MVDQDPAAAYCSPTSVDMSTTSPKSRSTWITYICGSFIVHWLHFNPPGGNVASLYVHKKQAINIGNKKRVFQSKQCENSEMEMVYGLNATCRLVLQRGWRKDSEGLD